MSEINTINEQRSEPSYCAACPPQNEKSYGMEFYCLTITGTKKDQNLILVSLTTNY